MASAEKSEDGGNCVTDDDGENRRALMEQDRQQQRERISQWKVYLLTYFYARQHICYSAYMLSPVRLSLCHTGGSYKNG